MNDYQAKLDAKRARYADMAGNARRESESRFNAAKTWMDGMPPGQPILIGHHSEGRHRSDLRKLDNNIRKGVEAERKAEHYADKAETYGTHSISSDDPEAVQRLRAKLADMESTRDRCKAVNAAYRKAGKPELSNPEGFASFVAAAELTTEETKGIVSLFTHSPYERQPYPSYSLTNIGARIKATKSRIDELSAPKPDAVDVECNGFTIKHNTDANRIQIIFPGKPDADTRAKLKARGFRWAPSKGAWQRQLNGNGIYAANAFRSSMTD